MKSLLCRLFGHRRIFFYQIGADYNRMGSIVWQCARCGVALSRHA